MLGRGSRLARWPVVASTQSLEPRYTQYDFTRTFARRAAKGQYCTCAAELLLHSFKNEIYSRSPLSPQLTRNISIGAVEEYAVLFLTPMVLYELASIQQASCVHLHARCVGSLWLQH